MGRQGTDSIEEKRMKNIAKIGLGIWLLGFCTFAAADELTIIRGDKEQKLSGTILEQAQDNSLLFKSTDGDSSRTRLAWAYWRATARQSVMASVNDIFDQNRLKNPATGSVIQFLCTF